jgi:hypothetical protein
MKATLLTKRFVRCPHGCAHEFSVEHLSHYEDGRQFGPWFCDDCGRGWNFTKMPDGFDVTGDKKRMVFGKVILVLPPQTEPIYFTLDSSMQDRPLVDREEGLQYLYEQHSCPVNWFRDMVEMQIGDNKDPHGVLKFVRYFDVESPTTTVAELGTGE